MQFLSAREILDERGVGYAIPEAITTINSGVIVCSGVRDFFRGASQGSPIKDSVILIIRHSCPPSSGHKDFYMFCGAMRRLFISQLAPSTRLSLTDRRRIPSIRLRRNF